MGLNLEEAIKQKNKIFVNINASSIPSSLHYEIFAGISQYYLPMTILEIGTHDGFFTSYLSHLFNKVEITTLDLPFIEDDKTVAEAHQVQNQNYGDNKEARCLNLGIYRM